MNSKNKKKKYSNPNDVLRGKRWERRIGNPLR